MSDGTWRFMLGVNVTGGEKEATVGIAVNPDDPPFVAIMVAAEHMMTAAAMHSEAGFEKALELLCQGARSNKVKMFQGHRTDQ